jgi:hypothetical protein
MDNSAGDLLRELDQGNHLGLAGRLGGDDDLLQFVDLREIGVFLLFGRIAALGDVVGGADGDNSVLVAAGPSNLVTLRGSPCF